VNPLSPIIYYHRHKRSALLLIGMVALVTLGVHTMIGVTDSFLEYGLYSIHYLSNLTRVSATDGLDAATTAQIRAHPGVAHIIPAVLTQLRVTVPPGGEAEVDIYGVAEDDLPGLMALFELDLVEDHLPRPRSNEVVIPRAAALNRGLRVGDKIGQPVQETQTNLMSEDDIPMEMEIVGLLNRDDLWIGFSSREYLESHDLTATRPPRWLVVPVEGRKPELDAWLEESIASSQVRVSTYDAIRNEFRQVLQGLSILFAAVEFLIAAVAAIALAALNTIFFAQRREEFGILHAIGHSRRWLVRRTARESASVVAVAWLLSVILCGIGLIYMQAAVFAPKGMTFNLFSPAPWAFTLPMPVAVVTVSAGLIARTLRKLDPVAVIERR
jgi:ABC-type lipoprotein release transport system permease subunit